MQHNRAELTAKQERAVTALVSGETVKDAAKAAGVDRSTVHRWLKDPDFLAELNLRRSELRKVQEQRLMNLASDALGVVEESIGQGDARTALAVLRGVGLLSGQLQPIGPLDPVQIRTEQALKERSLELDGFLASI